jgi:hypothetical protein
MRVKPHQLSPLDPAGDTVADGSYVVEVVGGVATGLAEAPAAGVQSVTEGTGVNVDNTDPLNPVVALESRWYVLTSVVAGEPVLVWDGDSLELVYTEVPLT